MGAGQGAEDTAAALYDDPNPALDVADMFRSSRSVDDDVGGMIGNLVALLNSLSMRIVQTGNPARA